MKGQKLTDKQKKFVEEYLVDLNATQAAIRAGYSKKTADKTAAKLVVKSCIKNAISEEIAKRSKRTEITQDRVLKELAKIGFADIKDYLQYRTEKTQIATNDEGEPIIGYREIIDIKTSEEVDGTIINEVSISKDGTFKFKLYDKLSALEKMGKHLGMFTEKVDNTGEVKLNINIKRV